MELALFLWLLPLLAAGALGYLATRPVHGMIGAGVGGVAAYAGLNLLPEDLGEVAAVFIWPGFGLIASGIFLAIVLFFLPGLSTGVRIAVALGGLIPLIAFATYAISTVPMS